MICKPILSPHLRQDGTAQIKIYVNEGGKKKKYIGTKIHVDPKLWDAKRGVVKPAHPMAMVYNARVKKQLIEIETHLMQGGSIDNLGVNKIEFVVDLIDKIVDEATKGTIPLKPGTTKTYRALAKRIRQYCAFKNMRTPSFDEVNMSFYRQFCDWLEAVAGCGIAGIGKHIKVLKSVMSAGIERGLHTNTVHQSRAFKAHKILSSSKIYLNTEEIAAMEGVDLSAQPALERERDRFLLSYYFIQRYSDTGGLSRAGLFEKNGGRYLRMVSTKTQKECVIPIKPAAYLLLEKYDWKLGFSSNQQANRHLKEIAKMAGINGMVTQDGQAQPKYNFVCTHTARRSAATNLYLAGAPLKLIADLGGWEKQETLRVYLRASGLETAMLAEGMEFFK